MKLGAFTEEKQCSKPKKREKLGNMQQIYEQWKRARIGLEVAAQK